MIFTGYPYLSLWKITNSTRLASNATKLLIPTSTFAKHLVLGKLSEAVVISLAHLWVCNLNTRPGRVHAQSGAFHESVVVANLDNFRQGEVGIELFVLWPRNPEHSCGLKMAFEFGKYIVHLRLSHRKAMKVIELPSEFSSNIQFGQVDGPESGLWRIHKQCSHSLFETHLLRYISHREKSTLPMNNIEPGNDCYVLRRAVLTPSATAPIISRMPSSAAPGASSISPM